MQPVFLDISQIMRLHHSLIEHYGGAEGLREQSLLLAAVAMPQATFEGNYLHTDLFEMGAAYLYHIVQGHPFVDGNKRTGAAAALVFLALNGLEVEADEDGLVEMTIAVASGKCSKAQAADFLRRFAL